MEQTAIALAVASTVEDREKVFLIVDTETTGLPPTYRCCEMAIRQIDPISLKTVKEWQSLIDPECPIPPGATEIHGITDDMVADAPTMEEFIETVIMGAFAGCDITFIAHNVPFDVKLCLDIGDITRTVCTLAWARILVPEAPNCKLQTLRAHFDYPEGEAHRAMADVATTHRILTELLKRAGRTLEAFAATEKHNIYVMPWGQHKSQLIMGLPGGYLSWLKSLPDLDPNLMDAVKKAIKAQAKK